MLELVAQEADPIVSQSIFPQVQPSQGVVGAKDQGKIWTAGGREAAADQPSRKTAENQSLVPQPLPLGPAILHSRPHLGGKAPGLCPIGSCDDRQVC